MSVVMSSLEQYAADFAAAAHAAIGQRRKYTDAPYIEHPRDVADLVREVPHTEEQLAAAWLHDVVEDTPITLEDVRARFGDAVAQLVSELTDVSRPEDGTRDVRKTLDRAHLAKASAAAKTVKLADLIDNSRSIVARDPGFARVYLAEKRLLLPFLKDGDPTLWARANAIAWSSTVPVAPRKAVAPVAARSDICIFCFRSAGAARPWCSENPGNGCTYGLGHEFPPGPADKPKATPRKVDRQLCTLCGVHAKNPASEASTCAHEYPASAP